MTSAQVSAPPFDVPWPSAWKPADATKVAAACFALLFNGRRYIHRRVENIVFVDENSVRRRVSVDFTVPQLPPEMLGVERATGEQVCFVPLTLLRKRSLRAFDLCDEDGRTLPMLTREQNAEIAFRMLLAASTVALDGEAPHPDVERDLRDVASGARDEAVAALRRLLTPDENCPTREQRLRIMAEPRIECLCEDLAHSFLCLVPVAAVPGQRRIIKLAYEEEPGARLTDAHGRWRRLKQTFGWEPVPYLLPASSMGDSASYHVEVAVPEDLEIARTRTLDLLRKEVLAEHIEPKGAQRVHIHAPNEARTVWGVLEVSVLVARSGLLMTSLAMTLITALLLTFGWSHLDTLAERSDATSAMLLAIPAIFIGYLLRPDEHPLVTRLFKGLRGLVMLSGACALTGAACVVVGIDGADLAAVWEPLVYASWMSAGALAGSFLLSRRPRERISRRSRKHNPGSPQALPPAGLQQALADSELRLQGIPVESAEGWRSSFPGVDSEAGVQQTLALAQRMLAVPASPR